MIFYDDEQLYNTIGINIRYFRKRSGLTQVELAQKSGVSISYISKLESCGCSKSISISALNNIANALDIRLVRFFEKRIRK